MDRELLRREFPEMGEVEALGLDVIEQACQLARESRRLIGGGVPGRIGAYQPGEQQNPPKLADGECGDWRSALGASSHCLAMATC